jgi:hypothetical protein
MSLRNPKVVLGVVIFILLAITALWGLSTYGLGHLIPPSVRESPGAAGTWSALVVVVIGLLAGWVSIRYLMRRRELPGGMWTALASGVGGAWLGGILPCPEYCRWLDINVVGSIVLAFALAVGVGRIIIHWRGKGR